MTNFSVGTVKSNKQSAMAYIVYMIAGSYFKDAKMENHTLEQKLFIDYKLLSVKEQGEKEEKIDRLVMQQGKEFLEKIEELKCVVHVKMTFDKKGKRIICLWFETGLEEMIIAVDESGRVSFEKRLSADFRYWAHIITPAFQGRISA